MAPLFVTPTALLLLVPLGVATIWMWRQAYPHLSRERRVAALCVRLAIITLVVLGIAGLSMRIPEQRMAVVYVADLSASDARDRSAMQNFIDQSTRSRPGDGLSGVVSVGGNAAVEQPPLPITGFGSFGTRVSRGSTDLERGIELASGIIPDGYRRRVVVLSDGRQNAGNALLAASILASRGTRVDVVPQTVRSGPDLRITSVSLPHSLSPAEHFRLQVHLQSNSPMIGTLDVERDGTLLGTRRIRVPRGATTVSIPQRSLRPGFHTFTAHVTSRVDTQLQNNVGTAFTIVGGPPRILVVAARPAEARNVVADLKATGLATNLRSPSQLVPSLDWLQRYSSAVIVNTSADALGNAFMAQLVPYTRDLGHGLVVIGGQQAYGLGGYGNTPLDQILPVHMNIPQRKDLPTVGVVLIVESLEAPLPVNLSKEAAKGVLQLLGEQDKIAVNDAPGDGTSGWILSLRPAVDKPGIGSAIDSMTPGDPSSYSPYLRSAAQVLARAGTRLKHIILLGDGDAYDENYVQLARSIKSRGITISTVGTNEGGPRDAATLRTIARYGGGKYYHADDVANVPKIFLHEAQTVARSGVVPGSFTPRAVSLAPGVPDAGQMPTLSGYVATTPKSRAEMILVSKKFDPVLATWQYGLGRTVAWTSDASGLWTRAWLRAHATRHFWSTLVRSSLPTVSQRQLFVSTALHGPAAAVGVQTPPALGSHPQVQARIGVPGGRPLRLALQPSAPGRFSGTFSAVRQGSYPIHVTARGAGHALTGEGGLDVAYPPEYAGTGTDRHFLRRLARAGHGALLDSPEGAWTNNVPAVYAEEPLAAILWLIAAVLFPVDIALRRLALSRRDLLRIREAMRPSRRAA